ncbi:MAG TPA: DEAD/DEAH box helicase [archaeon]|nr:DEAD/DEAH box helicase [archaeon]
MDLKEIKLDERLLRAISEMGFTTLTEIQQKSIPHVQKGNDVIGQSSTGSGKTAAFGLPILEKIIPKKGIQALILTPTRELCVQVSDSLKSFAKYTDIKITPIYGGVNINPQKQHLQTAEVVVGTPGRILDHMRSRSLKLDSVKFFVLDETDRMCDMGFYEDVEHIIRSVPQKRQTLLFSATYTKDVDKLVAKYMNSPVTLQTEAYVDPALLDQMYYDVSPAEKFSVLLHLIKKNSFGLSLVFCRTRSEVDVVARNLKKHGIQAMPIHGGLTQSRRMRALESLKREHIDVLVATDVAARGLDISGVFYVYNYDVPPTSEEYIHRIGRTARAGKNGHAISLLSHQDHLNFRSVLRNSAINVRHEQTPVVEIVQLERKERRHNSPGHRPHSSHSYNRPGSHQGNREHSRPQRSWNSSSEGLSNSDYRDISSPGRSGGTRPHSRNWDPKRRPHPRSHSKF